MHLPARQRLLGPLKGGTVENRYQLLFADSHMLGKYLRHELWLYGHHQRSDHGLLGGHSGCERRASGDATVSRNGRCRSNHRRADVRRADDADLRAESDSRGNAEKAVW